jgi:hypothetical protein
MSEFEVATLAGSYREPSFDNATVAEPPGRRGRGRSAGVP